MLQREVAEKQECHKNERKSWRRINLVFMNSMNFNVGKNQTFLSCSTDFWSPLRNTRKVSHPCETPFHLLKLEVTLPTWKEPLFCVSKDIKSFSLGNEWKWSPTQILLLSRFRKCSPTSRSGYMQYLLSGLFSIAFCVIHRKQLPIYSFHLLCVNNK